MLSRRDAILASIFVLAPSYVEAKVARTDVAGIRRFGVQAHLGHSGASVASIEALRSASLLPTVVRDEVFWARFEPTRGVYNWSYADKVMDTIHRSGAKLILEFTFSNKSYADNDFAFPATEAARAGFSRYAMALLERYAHRQSGRYPDLIAAVEVWNEANGSFGGGYSPRLVASPLAALTRSVHDAMRADPAYDHIKILGGASVGVPMGFLEWCFDAGLGEVIDGVAVHPYGAPEKLLTNLSLLRSWLDERGHGRLGVWATEFGNVKSASEMARLMAVCCAAPLDHASYYLAQSNATFSSGLLDTEGAVTSVGRAWRYWLPLLDDAQPVGRASLQPKTYALKFVSPKVGPFVIVWSQWGQTTILVRQADRVVGATGDALPPRESYVIGQDPIAIFGGEITEQLPGAAVISDAYEGFSTIQGHAGWRYLSVSGKAERELTLATEDPTVWTDRQAAFSKISNDSLHPSFVGRTPVVVTRRYTFAENARCRVIGQWSRGPKGDGTHVSVAQGGKILSEMTLIGETIGFDHTFEAEAGQAIDFAAGPTGASKDFDEVRFYATLYRVEAEA